MKVVINSCFGGFSLSPAALLDLYAGGMSEIATHIDDYWPEPKTDADRKSAFSKYGEYGLESSLKTWRKAKETGANRVFLHVFSPDEQFVLNSHFNFDRSDPRLIDVVERLGEKASGACAFLKIVEIPDGTDYVIEEYDGNEHIAEKHRTWA